MKERAFVKFQREKRVNRFKKKKKKPVAAVSAAARRTTQDNVRNT